MPALGFTLRRFAACGAAAFTIGSISGADCESNPEDSWIRSHAMLWLGIAFRCSPSSCLWPVASRRSVTRRCPLGCSMPSIRTTRPIWRPIVCCTSSCSLFIHRFLPREWPLLEWPLFEPLVKCGQQSLDVFCTGVFLAVGAHVVLVEVSRAVWIQIVVSVVGIGLMSPVAYYRSWSTTGNKKKPPPSSANAGG